MARRAFRSALVLLTGSALAWTFPASADVKTGVDAWTAGDYARAVREWADPAAKGDPDAQFNLAQAYRLGRGVDVDMKQAEALYARAAAQGHVQAADNYGLLLFQDGKREEALPYIVAAAGRGDPRAQYLLGIAHFNGDLVAKDWRRAYALMTLANSVGLPQAKSTLVQMDEYIPQEDRQAAQTLAAQLRGEAEAARQRDLAAVDLALAADSPSGPVVTTPRAPQAAPAVARAGADYTLPPASDVAAETMARTAVAASSTPVRVAQASPAPAAAARVAAPVSGPWKLQLGAFGVAGNADRLWSQLASRRELAGRAKLKVSAGKLTKLLAGGFATRAEAEAACASLKAGGQACLVTQ